jgi:hypothetical protein
MHGLEGNPIDINSIGIDDSTIDFFEERLKNMLKNCVIDTCGKSNRFKHFKRR